MKKYKIKLQRIQRGVVLDWSKEKIIESNIKPKVGEGKTLFVNPPIRETIISVEEIEY